MGEIRKKKKKVNVFITTDGEKFGKRKHAQRHQDVIDGKIKLCSLCHGSGRNPYYSNHVGGSEPECPYCHGTGEK